MIPEVPSGSRTTVSLVLNLKESRLWASQHLDPACP